MSCHSQPSSLFLRSSSSGQNLPLYSPSSRDVRVPEKLATGLTPAKARPTRALRIQKVFHPTLSNPETQCLLMLSKFCFCFGVFLVFFFAFAFASSSQNVLTPHCHCHCHKPQLSQKSFPYSLKAWLFKVSNLSSTTAPSVSFSHVL